MKSARALAAGLAAGLAVSAVAAPTAPDLARLQQMTARFAPVPLSADVSSLPPSALEEAKADITGLWALQYLVDKGPLDRSLERTMYTTFLASAFRSIRFGTNEAHGRGIAIQLNRLLDAGAFRVNADGTFAVDDARIREAVTALSRELLTLQAEGNADAARRLVTEQAVVRPEVQRVLDKLSGVPVDIEPRFVTADELAGPQSPLSSRKPVTTRQ